LDPAKLILGRYLLFGITGIEILLLPKLLSDENYVEVEYWRQLFNLSPLLLFGAGSGYIILYHKQKVDYSKTLLYYNIAILFGTVFVGIITSPNQWYLSFIVIGALGISLERIYQAKGYLILASLLKPIISVLFIFLLVVTNKNSEKTTIIICFVFCLLLSVVIYLLIGTAKRLITLRFNLTNYKPNIKDLLKCIKNGYYINLTSYIVVLQLFLQRNVILEYHPNVSRSYTFSFALATCLSVASTSLALLNQNKIGTNTEKYTLYDFNKMVRIALQVYTVVTLLFSAICLPILQYIYDIDQFLIVFVLTQLTFGLYTAISSVFSVGYYYNCGILLLKLHVVAFIADLISTYILLYVNSTLFIIVLVKPFGILIIVSIVYLYILKTKIPKSINNL
jgi:hypothetical protein